MSLTKNKHKNAFLSFQLGKEIFAISVKKVLEVLEKQRITEVPDVPEFLKGVINFRGDILPVIDTRQKFKMTPSDDENFVIIVMEISENDKNMRVCAIVDSVHDVIAVEDSEIRPVPELGLKYRKDFLIGMIKTSTSFIMVLDINQVFTFEEIQIISEIKSE